MCFLPLNKLSVVKMVWHWSHIFSVPGAIMSEVLFVPFLPAPLFGSLLVALEGSGSWMVVFNQYFYILYKTNSQIRDTVLCRSVRGCS